MAHTIDEHFYTNIYHGLSQEQKKTIRDNIVQLQESSNFLQNTSDYMSFASIFAGPLIKASSFGINKLVDDLNETGNNRLNDKVKILARNEESSKLLSTLYETKNGQTPHIIMLSELVKRHQDNLTELSKKYDNQTVQKIYNISMNAQNLSQEGKLQEVQQDIAKLNTWMQATYEEKYNTRKIQDYHSTFSFLSQVGTASGCADLEKTANIAMSGLIIRDSLSSLSSALASSGSLAGIINPITSLICVGMGLFKMFKKKKSNTMAHMNLIVQQLNLLRQELRNIQSEIRNNFKIVFEYLQYISEKLYMQHTISLNIYNKIEQLEKNINNISVICEYYGKQNLLQDLYRTIFKITRGTPEYFRNLGQSGFNEMFMDIFFWLNNHSFDCGINGYIYSSTSGNIVANLNTSVHNRLGYMAYLLQFPEAKNMVNHKIFEICVQALEILINQALPYYGTLPLSYDNIVPVMNRANLTEQFMIYSKQPQVLAGLISSYNNNVDILKSNLSQWVDNISQRYAININSTLEQMVSATPISSGLRYASDINGHFTSIPITPTSAVNCILQIYKMCEVAIKLGIGNYDFRFSLAHGHIKRGNIPVTIDMLMDFILNGTRYNINCERWHAPDLYMWLNPTLTSHQVLAWWQHDYKSKRWTLQNYTQTNTHFENILRQACTAKLQSIKQELTSISYTIGTQVNTLCDKLQEQYTIILKLFELNETKLNGLNSGSWIKTRLKQLIDHENTYGHTILTFCDFVKTKALDTKAVYDTSQIAFKIRDSIDRLNRLSADVVRYQNDYKYIQETEKNAKAEYQKLLEEEKLLIEEEKKKKIIAELKVAREQENEKINQIGIKIGRSLTLQTIITNLEQANKQIEAKIIKREFEQELQGQELETVDNKEMAVMFNSSFCNGSSLVLLEICTKLYQYPQTMMEIQKMGCQVLTKIMTSSDRTISYTMNKLI